MLWTGVVFRAVLDLRYLKSSKAWRRMTGERALAFLFDAREESDLVELCRRADLDVESVRRVARDFMEGRRQMDGRRQPVVSPAPLPWLASS